VTAPHQGGKPRSRSEALQNLNREEEMPTKYKPTHCVHCGNVLTITEAKKYECDIEQTEILPDGFCNECATEYDHK
jgi:hydrogenase maturation factor HypF (carbamoyltransferase family)